MRVASLCCVAIVGGVLPVVTQEQRPVFRTGTDVVLIETQVVNSDGRPVRDLRAEDFVVKIGGRAPLFQRRSCNTRTESKGSLAKATLYVMHRDDDFLDSMSVRKGRGAKPSTIRDSARLGAGLEFVAGAADGHLFRVQAGTSEYAFGRVLRESSAFYVLGVATDTRDRDGKSNLIDVSVRPAHSAVRHRRSMVIAPVK